MSGWQSHALCAQVDPDAWFPEEGARSDAIKRVCQRCPVRAECLADALARHDTNGIWGGLSYTERLALRTRPVVRQLESAREHARLLTALPVPEAARELGISERTVHRWRVALREAS
jgi:WhiB family transcriptional regulator, redox-sensing transcriptional regulator